MQATTSNENAAREAGQKNIRIIKCGRTEIPYVTDKPPRLSLAHVETFSTLNMSTLKIGKEQSRKVPDRIHTCGSSWDINALGEAKAAPSGAVPRVMTDEDVAELEKLDAAILAAQLARKNFLKEAATRGRIVNRHDCI